MAKEVKKRRGAWFWAFWVLLLTLLLSIVLVLTALFRAGDQSGFSSQPLTQSQASFDVVLTRTQVNAISAKFLKEQKIKNLSLDVGTQQADLYGSVKFLGSNINVGVAFTPSVAADGSILLRAKRLVAGSMPLPISFVLRYIDSAANLPKFVNINATKKTIRIDVSRMKTGKLLAFKAKTIDLKKDKIIFQGDLK
ncbi:YpmS family protein [Oenococcus kitaharae]|uniref:YpmS family protein n=1 Tax=Oenococcus TaxID=46254 RepID=UPI0021E72355|nr:YpmS family protein [Oenococcus kitaharae]MCV3295809.1 YpmS family protein [Oenococcus kitaharae]